MDLMGGVTRPIRTRDTKIKGMDMISRARKMPKRLFEIYTSFHSEVDFLGNITFIDIIDAFTKQYRIIMVLSM